MFDEAKWRSVPGAARRNSGDTGAGAGAGARDTGADPVANPDGVAPSASDLRTPPGSPSTCRSAAHVDFASPLAMTQRGAEHKRAPSFSSSRIMDLTPIESAAQRAWALAASRVSTMSRSSNESDPVPAAASATAPATAPAGPRHRPMDQSVGISFLPSDCRAMDLSSADVEGSDAGGEGGEGCAPSDATFGGESAAGAVYGDAADGTDPDGVSFEIPEPCVMLSGADGEALMNSAWTGLFHSLLFIDTTSVEFRAVSRFTLNFRRHCDNWINRFETFRVSTVKRARRLRR